MKEKLIEQDLLIDRMERKYEKNKMEVKDMT
jgi:hypothetical protein